MRPLLASILAAVAVMLFSTPCDAKDHRNVLFLIADDLNTDLGCYGHRLVKSPNIDRLATRGVRFSQAYCQYPVCNPSRASFMTGLYPEQTGSLTNGINFRDRLPDVMTMAQMFRQGGYWAGRVGKIYHFGVPGEIGTAGLDDPASWDAAINPIGRDKTEEDKIISIAPHRNFGGTLSWLAADGTDEEQTDGIGATEAIKLLETHKDKPFFLAVGFYRPHTPYVAPKQYFEMYPRDQIELVNDPSDDRDDIPPCALPDRPYQREMDDAKRREVIQAYYASITFMDAQVGRVLDALERLGLAENTVIVFTSDHGYHMGHHDLWQKGDLFEGSVRVPLIIARPEDVSAGRSTAALAEMVDLYPTLAELTGLKAPSYVRGMSLRPVLDEPGSSVRDSAYTVAYARHGAAAKPRVILGRTVRTQRYRYTRWGDDGEHGQELYDYAADPGEYTNLAGHLTHASTLTHMQRLLAERRRQANVSVDP